MRNALSFEQYSCSRNALSNVQRNNPGVLCPCRVLQFVSQEYASFFKISFIVVVRRKFLRFAVNRERGSPSVRASNISRFVVISFREVISLTVVRVRGGRSELTISAGFFLNGFARVSSEITNSCLWILSRPLTNGSFNDCERNKRATDVIINLLIHRFPRTASRESWRPACVRIKCN